MNNWVGGPGWDSSGPWRPNAGAGWKVYLKTGDMDSPGPSGTFVLLDEREDSINDGYFVVDMAGYPSSGGQWKIVDYPASYHNKAGGFSFADGHAEIRKWKDKSITGKDAGIGGSIDKKVDDYLWLSQRTTTKL